MFTLHATNPCVISCIQVLHSLHLSPPEVIPGYRAWSKIWGPWGVVQKENKTKLIVSSVETRYLRLSSLYFYHHTIVSHLFWKKIRSEETLFNLLVNGVSNLIGVLSPYCNKNQVLKVIESKSSWCIESKYIINFLIRRLHNY